MNVRKLINRVLLQPRGYQLLAQHSFPDRFGHSLALLSEAGVAPQTVIDIGVATGTPWLYRAFPEAKLVLIDPNPRFTGALAALKDRHRADVYCQAVGARNGTVTLHIDRTAPSSSSLLNVTETLTAARGERTYEDVVVPMRTLDALMRGAGYQRPFLLKIDTEGSELDILAGAETTLTHTAAVIAEVSVIQRFAGSYAFADLIHWMHRRGFRVFDVAAVRTLGARGPINYMDVVFIREDLAQLTGVLGVDQIDQSARSAASGFARLARRAGR